MVRVKICGLTKEDDVRAAVEAGADAVGFICGFPQSPRNLSLSRAGRLMDGVPPFVNTVLVTNSELVARNRDRIFDFSPSFLQIYGEVPKPAELRERLGARLILPHLMKGDGKAQVDPRGFDAVLSDTYRKGHSGGTGATSDWDACKRLKDLVAPLPLILSGGLNPENVEEAIGRVGPFAVDASSGVEVAPGVKDPDKVRAFVRRAKGRA